tara:strand:- start:161 stop:355 length:195 start_codon:yes stop_codon:yes gene_type:complete
MTDITKYKSVALDHDCYSKIKKLSEKLCPGANLSLAAVVRVLVNDRVLIEDLADDNHPSTGIMN